MVACPSFAGLDERIKVAIEEPVQGGRYSGISNLRGWAVSPEGVGLRYHEVYIDGAFAFYLGPYGRRSDVGDAFPDYPDSGTGGFSMAFNYKGLSPGEHEIAVRAFDNAGNYNDAITTFSAERFESLFITDDAEVNLSTLSGVTVLNNQTLLFRGATIEGRSWDFNVSWDRASQGLVITNIDDGSSDSGGADGGGYTPPSNDDGIGSTSDSDEDACSGTGYNPNCSDSSSDSTSSSDDGSSDSGGGESGDADSGSEGNGFGAPPDYTRVVATCNTYVTGVEDGGLVWFENGATQEERFEGLEWSEEDPAFFVEFADGLMVVVQYDPALLTKVDRESDWSAFWQVHVGAPPESCAYREPKSARPLIPDYDVGNIYDYRPFDFVEVLPCNEFYPRPASCHTAGIPRFNLDSDKACPTWDLEDQVLIPEAWDYYWLDFRVDPVLNLTRLRYEDGQPWCLE